MLLKQLSNLNVYWCSIKVPTINIRMDPSMMIAATILVPGGGTRWNSPEYLTTSPWICCSIWRRIWSRDLIMHQYTTRNAVACVEWLYVDNGLLISQISCRLMQFFQLDISKNGDVIVNFWPLFGIWTLENLQVSEGLPSTFFSLQTIIKPIPDFILWWRHCRGCRYQSSTVLP